MKEEKQEKKVRFRWLRRIARVLLAFLVLFILLILLIRSPWGQSIIVEKATSYVSDKTNTKVEVDRLFITFSGNVFLDGLYLEDQKGDTLVYSKNLEVDVPLWPVLMGDAIGVNFVEWYGLKANVSRKDSIEGFNYQFLIDAFEETEEAKKTDEEPESSPMDFYIKDVYFSDFNLKYNDEVGGIESYLNLGKLNLEMNKMDMETMNFHISKAEIFNTDLQFLQLLPVAESEETASTTLPVVIVDELILKNVSTNFKSIPDGIHTVADIGELSIELPMADLSKNIIDMNHLGLHNSTISAQLSSKEAVQAAEEADSTQAAETPGSFEWPDWTISLSKVNFTNNNIRYALNDAKPQPGIFNPEVIILNDFYFVADDISLKEQAFEANITDSRFKEQSGLNLSELSFATTIDENRSDFSDFKIQLNKNKVNTSFAIQYNSIHELINQPESTTVNLNIENFDVDLNEVFRFQPKLKSNETLVALSKKRFNGNLVATGRLSSIRIPNSKIKWGGKTQIQANGKVLNPMDIDDLGLDFPTFNFTTVRNDVLLFIDEDELGIPVPEKISLQSNFKGALDDLNAVASLTIPEGQIDIQGHYTDKGEIAYDADLLVKQLQLGQLLNNEQLGELNLSLKSSGNGSDINSLDATFESIVESFVFNDYDIKDLKIAADIENGEGTIGSAYKDENLDLVLESFIQLDSISPRFVVDLNLKGADLKALGVTDKEIRGALVLHGDFKGNADSFTLSSNIKEGKAIYDNQSYLLGDLDINALVQPDTTSVDISNKMLDLKLRSNANPENFSVALQDHLRKYLSDTSLSETPVAFVNKSTQKPVELKLDGRLHNAPILGGVFIDRLQELDKIDFRMDFSETNQSLSVNIFSPHIDYDDSVLDSLTLDVYSDFESFDFDFGFQSLTSGLVAISKTALNGSIVDQKLFLDFHSLYKGEKIVQVNSEMSRRADTVRFHINPSELLLNKKEWSIPQENEMVYTENQLVFSSFSISRNSQLFELSSSLLETEKEQLGVRFENFRLSDFLNYLNPEETLATGRLNGNVIVEEPFLSPGLLANLQIEELNVMKVPLGNLALDAKEVSEDNYDLNLVLNGGDIDLDITGGYQSAEEEAKLDLNLVLNELKMSAIEGFSDGELTDTKGILTGEMEIGGTTSEPNYEGSIQFKEAGFRVTKLNAGFLLRDETMQINNEGLFLDKLKILDERENKFVVKGSILAESFTNPEFDLQFNAKDFSALNATKGDNELFYGTAVFDVDGRLTGNLDLPRLNVNLKVGAATDITYILMDSELEIEERDGVVVFVDREDPDEVRTQKRAESYTAKGFAVDANIAVHEDAVFNVIIDERTGDKLRVGGDADLRFGIEPNGRTTLTGKYTMQKGHFEMNLYNVVKKRFEIVSGSSVSWSGDPFDANLDVRAIYRVETSAASLMTSGGVGMDNRYRQELPFLVYLNVDGQLTEPLLTFNLDMPEGEKGAVGGQVYGRIQQLNQQEAELNKQVFSLLVLNRFFPQSGSDGSGGGTMAIAQDNLNEALSDQLNMFSDQLLGETGVELDFGIDSYTDYQAEGPQDRTQVDITARKKLFNDRLIVSVGSEVDVQGNSQNPNELNPIIGNVSIEYLLTENGRLRLKGFRRNQFENVIDGQVIVNGIALTFSREFNEYKELFAKSVQEELEKTQAEEDDEE